MKDSAESGFFRPSVAGEPMLLECDSLGRVLWTSQRTRAYLSNPTHLLDLLRSATPDAARRAAKPLRFWLVWEFRSSVVIGAQATEGDSGETQDLLDIQRRLSLHFLQLLEFERRLSVSAQRRRGSRTGHAIRQLELERQRLGRELHTGVGQLLAAIRLHLEVIAVEMPEPSGKVGQALDSISTLAADTLEQVRSISKRLHPPEWQRLTLESAIRQLWAVSGIPERFQASLEIDPRVGEPDLDVKILIYRGLQEALSNIVRHAKATCISVELGLREAALVLTVHDNGVGFNAERLFSAPANLDSGIGLRAIRETAQDLGGELEVESGPAGTRLVISVAMSPPAS